MKRMLLLVVALLATLTLSAQLPWRTINASTCLLHTSVTFTNGKQFTPNFFAGYGMGVENTTVFNFNFHDKATGETTTVSVGGVGVPLFVDGKWRVFDTWISPSIRCRAGAMFNLKMMGAGGFVHPEVGLDISRYFTIALGLHAEWLYTDFGWYKQSSYPNLAISIRF